MKITLPWALVAHDNHRLVPAFRRRGLIQSPAYKATKELAEWEIRRQWKGAPLTGRVSLVAEVFFPDKRKRDAGNYRKMITDAMSLICYADDAQLYSETWVRAGIDKQNPRIEITLTEDACLAAAD